VTFVVVVVVTFVVVDVVAMVVTFVVVVVVTFVVVDVVAMVVTFLEDLKSLAIHVIHIPPPPIPTPLFNRH